MRAPSLPGSNSFWKYLAALINILELELPDHLAWRHTELTVTDPLMGRNPKGLVDVDEVRGDVVPARHAAGLRSLPKQSTMTAPSQRRKSLRAHLDTDLRASITAARRGSTHVRDLAIGGAFLETEQHFELGESMRVEILSGSQPFECDAIIRNTSRLGIGIEFVEIKTAERERLRLLISGLLL